MPLCVYSVFVLSCVGSAFATGYSPVQGVLSTVYRIHNLRINSECEQTRRPNISRQKNDGYAKFVKRAFQVI
jgi:hypothetical protein